VVLHGDPAERLLGLIEADDIGLVVMTSHGRSGLRRAVLGSVADRLVRHGVPALITHPVPATALAADRHGAAALATD
jgi:nucleotide-binding universal stress UspA family protein